MLPQLTSATRVVLAVLSLIAMLPAFVSSATAQGRKPKPKTSLDLTYPPGLPGGVDVVVDSAPEFLRPPETLKANVAIAKTPPRVEFRFYPGQDYPGRPWSNWGDSLAVKGKYYSAIGDHLAIGSKGDGTHGTGTAFVFEYDSATGKLRSLVDVAKFLDLPTGHYTPGKIHSRLDLGDDGWLYYATHRGSIRATVDKYHYQGDWILRTHPATGKTEVVARGAVPKHAIPTSVLDPERGIFYGGTAPAQDREDEGIHFLAYDVGARKPLYAGPGGPARYMMFARSTGRVYFVPGAREGQLMRFDPQVGGPPKPVPGSHIGIRAATEETDDGFIYTASLGQRSDDATIWSFNTKTEKVRKIGTAAVGTQAYVASLDVDPSGRYLYYVPGAHGGGNKDGTPIVQFDVRTGRRKVLAFLEPFYTNKYGFTLKGTYATAVDPAGDKLYVTWNVSRGSRAWDCCGMTVIHIPESERR